MLYVLVMVILGQAPQIVSEDLMTQSECLEAAGFLQSRNLQATFECTPVFRQ